MFINKVQIYGNLTRDPELKSTQNGNKVSSFSVATNRTWKDKAGQKQEDSQFHNVVAWGRTAELVCQYLRKGGGIYVEGRLQTRNYDKNGSKHYITEVVAESIQFGPKQGPKTDAPDDGSRGLPRVDVDDAIDSDELPF